MQEDLWRPRIFRLDCEGHKLIEVTNLLHVSQILTAKHQQKEGDLC